MSKQQCIFCDIISGTIPAKTVGSTIDSIAFMDAFPIVAGHVLVVPKRHCEKIQDMSETECTDLFQLVQNMIKKVDTLTGSTLVAAHNEKKADKRFHMYTFILCRVAKTMELDPYTACLGKIQ